MDDLFVGSAKENEHGFTIELNVTKLMLLLEKPQITLALKTFTGREGEQTAVMLHLTKLEPDKQNKYRTHSVSINSKYRQGR